MTGWSTPTLIAAYVCRPERTIRDWARRGLVESMRDPKTGRLLVDVVSAQTMAQSTVRYPKRRRAA